MQFLNGVLFSAVCQDYLWKPFYGYPYLNKVPKNNNLAQDIQND